MQNEKHRLFGTKYVLPALLIVALAFAAVPATSIMLGAFDAKGPAVPTNEADSDDDEMNSDDDHENITSVSGTVTSFLYDDCDDDDNQSDEDDCYANDNLSRVCAFVIDNSTIVEFGPWWYWMTQTVNITDVVHVGDVVNVTGEFEYEKNGTYVLEAWHIKNITTGEELTIKEDGRPPWAGGPKAQGIDPWPPYADDDDDE
jgi:hypothetical protein